MKNLITILLLLVAVVVNGQTTDTLIIQNNSSTNLLDVHLYVSDHSPADGNVRLLGSVGPNTSSTFTGSDGYSSAYYTILFTYQGSSSYTTVNGVGPAGTQVGNATVYFIVGPVQGCMTNLVFTFKNNDVESHYFHIGMLQNDGETYSDHNSDGSMITASLTANAGETATLSVRVPCVDAYKYKLLEDTYTGSLALGTAQVHSTPYPASVTGFPDGGSSSGGNAPSAPNPSGPTYGTPSTIDNIIWSNTNDASSGQTGLIIAIKDSAKVLYDVTSKGVVQAHTDALSVVDAVKNLTNKVGNSSSLVTSNYVLNLSNAPSYTQQFANLASILGSATNLLQQLNATSSGTSLTNSINGMTTNMAAVMSDLQKSFSNAIASTLTNSAPTNYPDIVADGNLSAISNFLASVGDTNADVATEATLKGMSNLLSGMGTNGFQFSSNSMSAFNDLLRSNNLSIGMGSNLFNSVSNLATENTLSNGFGQLSGIMSNGFGLSHSIISNGFNQIGNGLGSLSNLLAGGITNKFTLTNYATETTLEGANSNLVHIASLMTNYPATNSYQEMMDAGASAAATGSNVIGGIFSGGLFDPSSSLPEINSTPLTDWTIRVPYGSGYDINLNPFDRPWVVKIATFMRNLIAWICVASLIYKNVTTLLDSVKILAMSRQAQSAGTSVLGNNANTLIAAAMAILITGVCLAVPLYAANWFGASGVISMVTATPFHTTSAAAVGTSIWMVDQFFPLAFMVWCVLVGIGFRAGLTAVCYGTMTVTRFLVG